MTIEEFADLLRRNNLRVKRLPDTNVYDYSAECPVHEDRRNSLCFRAGDKGIFLKCYADCSKDDILRKLGISWKDLFFGNGTKSSTAHKIGQPFKRKRDSANQLKTKDDKSKEVVKTEKIATYEYTDINGKVKYKIDRIHGYNIAGDRISKIFIPKHKENGKWINGLKNVKKIPYNLSEVLRAKNNYQPIWIVEGEKDVESMRKQGHVATTFCSGHTWQDEYKEYFEDTIIYIIPDNDAAGKEKARKIATGLYDTALFIKWVELPGLEEQEDVSDYFDKGGIYYDITDIAEESELFEINDRKINIEEIRKYIYKEIQKPRSSDIVLIDRRVCEKIREHYDIITTKEGNKVEYYIYRSGKYELIEIEQFAELFEHWIKEEDITDYRLNQICKLYAKRRNNFIAKEKLNSQKYLVNLNNCVYDLIKHRPLKHSPRYYFTYKVDFDFIPGAECPFFDEALKKYSLGDRDWIKTFWEIAGYVQTGSYEHQKLFWFLGKSGGNGKGTVLRIMHKLVGNQFTFTIPNTQDFGQQFFRQNLMGKRFAYVPDMERGLKNISIVKQLTGGDMQQSDVKFKKAIQFKSTAKILMAMNNLPHFGEGQNLSPLARRVIILNFNYTLTKKDINPDIEKRFDKEMPGIFNKSMQGLKRLQKERKFTGTFEGRQELRKYLDRTSLYDIWKYENIYYSDDLLNDEEESDFLFVLWHNFYRFMDENYPDWQKDKFINLQKSNSFKQKLLEDYSKVKTKYVSCYMSNYRDHKGNLKVVKGTYLKLLGLRLLEDDEKEKRLIEKVTKQPEGTYSKEFFDNE